MSPAADFGRRRVVKLVRHKIGRYLSPYDNQVHYEIVADDREHVRLLRGKLIEEAVEYLLDPSSGELADVLQAVRDLAEVDLGMRMEHIERVADEKYKDRGGFVHGIAMYVTTTAPAEGDK